MIPILLISHSKHALKRFLDEKNKEEKTITIFLSPEKTEYSIDQIREITKEVSIDQPLKQMYVLQDFDSSSLEAQNAFLKLLEEPPDNVEFILVVSNPYILLPTIISRTKIVRLDKRKENILDTKVFKVIKSLDFGSFLVSSKDECLILLVQICLFFRERYLEDPKSTSIMKEVLTVYRFVQNNNVNPQLALDHLLIFISKKYSMKKG